MIPIQRPWIILHETPDEKLECILAGRQGAGPRAFAMGAADIIRHIAKAFGMDEADVHRMVRDELENPTTNISESRVQ